MHEQADSTPVTGTRRSRSYLLRLWQEAPDLPWRAMLRCIPTKEVRLFRNIEELTAYLKTHRDDADALSWVDQGANSANRV
jgi:hypothetical protein